MSKFVWFEYVSKQGQQAQGFFGEVFNWTTKSVPMPQGNYTMIAIGDRTIGGFIAAPGASSEGAPEHAHWLTHLHVTDAAKAAAKIRSLGGKIAKEPFKVADFGTMGIAADPQGAAFALWQPASTEAAPAPIEGSFCWNELTAADPDAAAKFYAEVGGFEIEVMTMPGMDYTVLKSEGVPRAGVTKPMMPGQPNAWLPYVQVKHADTTADKAKRLGASIVVPPTDIPKVGRFAIFVDPNGAALGILQP
ncbi:MAG: VOC family protein [Kofleriaceae bacterium]